MGMLRCAHVVLALSLWGAAGCGKRQPVVVAAPLTEDTLLRSVSGRRVLDPAQAKLSVKLHSPKLGIVAPPLAGGLVADRPGRAFFTVLSPVGGPVLTLTTDGVGARMINVRDRQFIVAEDAAALLGDATGGTVTLDDVVTILLGLVPIAPERVRSRDAVEGGVQFVADGPAGTVWTAVVEEAHATPVSLVVADKAGAALVTATFEPFQATDEDRWMPSRVVIEVPSAELTVDVRYKSWTEPATAPDVFNPPAPEGYRVISFQDYAAEMKAKMNPG